MQTISKPLHIWAQIVEQLDEIAYSTTDTEPDAARELEQVSKQICAALPWRYIELIGGEEGDAEYNVALEDSVAAQVARISDHAPA